MNGQWAADTTARETLSMLGMGWGAADESTFRRVFALLDADLLAQAQFRLAEPRLFETGCQGCCCFPRIQEF